jgi:hypothetical protein
MTEESGSNQYPDSKFLKGSLDIENALNSLDPVYPVVLNFPYNGQQRSELLTFNHPINIPTRGDVVTFKFNDFGTIKRISASVEYTIREFYGSGVVSGVKAGYIVQILLTGITHQS